MGTRADAALIEGARALATGDDLDPILGRIAALATTELGYEAASIYLYDEAREALQPKAPDGATRAATELREVTEEGARFVPLIVGTQVETLAGVLEVRGAVDAAETVAALGGLADLAAIAIERGRLRSSLAERSEWFERLSQIDPLTGLANRQTFERAIELELLRAARHGTRVGLTLFDISGLAELNARLGRAAGDDALRRTAAILTANVRLIDTVARYGSDEFVVLAPAATRPALAERIVAAAAAERLEDGTPIGLRSGTAFFPDDGDTASELVAAAERAMRATPL